MKKRVLAVSLILSLILSGIGQPFSLFADEETSSVEGVTVLNQDFEDANVHGWAMKSWGSSGTVSVASDVIEAGNHALKVSERVANDSEPLLNLTEYLKSGRVYDISLKLSISAGTDAFHLSSKVAAGGNDDYPWLVGNQDVVSGQWTNYSRTGFEVPADMTEVLIWFERASSEDTNLEDLFIDDVLIVDVTPEKAPDRPEGKAFTTIDFEDGTASGFVARGGNEVLTVTDEANFTKDGQYALKVEGRTQNWNGPSLNVESFITLGLEYKISARVKLLEPASAQLQLSTQVGAGDSASYNNLQGATITVEDGWVLLEGTYRYTSVGDEFVTVYVESTNNATGSFYIDDITFEATGSGTVAVQKDLTPIKEVYKDYFLIGNAVSAKEFSGSRLELLSLHHDVVTAENAMKPGYAYGTYPEFDFTAQDALVSQIQAANLGLIGHVFVWHQQSEERLHTGEDGQPLDRETALANLRRHVKTVATHFSDDVIAWDVVNEAMNDNPPNPSDWRGSLRQSGWYQAIGADYVMESFLAAREAFDELDVDVKLYYNDYNDDNQSKAEAIYQMVKEINETYAAKNDGRLLIDGIGMQGHYNLNTNPENVEASLLKFISVTNEVSITELDITAGNDHVLTESEANQQAYLYAQLFMLYKTHHEHIARVTFWGLDDGTSWRAANNPLLFDSDLQAKPAYYAVIDPEGFIESYEPEVKDARLGFGVYGTPDIADTNDSLWMKAPELKLDQYQMAWQGASGVARVLWDENNLYVRVTVSDSQLDDTSANPWEQDSVEVFVDQNNAKSASFQSDDGQYRVNYNNIATGSTIEGFESIVTLSGTSYVVVMKVPFTAVTPVDGTTIGFDVQINDGQDGARQSVAIWNDLTGVGYMDTSVFGNLTLVTEYTDKLVLSRGGLVDLLVTAYGDAASEMAHDFTDVALTHTYSQAIGKAYGLGWIEGYPDGRFNPDGIVTRAEFATIMARILEDQGAFDESVEKKTAYADADLIPSFAEAAIMLLKDYGYMVGYPDNTYRPDQSMTHKEVVIVLSR